MARDFNTWLSTFRDSIADYKYYTDFEKVHRNVEDIKVELNILNSLIGSRNIEEDFKKILKSYPQILKCIPILLAVRSNEIYCKDEKGGRLYQFDFGKYPPNSHKYYEDYSYFMRETGLFDLLENHIINNLVDYVIGIETGLDSNARKSRSGHLMENLVETYIQKSGFIKNKTYFKEMKLSDVEKLWTLDLSSISNNGKTEKKFDFVIKTSSTVYAIETNFYSQKGSKPNETARSYKMIALESQEINGFEFIWFTDGRGWKSSRNNLEESFDVMEHIYNIKDLENGILNRVLK